MSVFGTSYRPLTTDEHRADFHLIVQRKLAEAIDASGRRHPPRRRGLAVVHALQEWLNCFEVEVDADAETTP